MAVNKDKIYALSANSIYMSDNEGDTWTYLWPLSTDDEQSTFAIRDSNIYTGNIYGSVEYSYDGGLNWDFHYFGGGDFAINDIAVKDSIIFVGTMGKGIYYSSDNGKNWIAKNNELTNFNIISIVICDNKIFAAELGGGYLFSTNNGDKWIKANDNLSQTYITIFEVDEHNNIFAGTLNDGLFVSTDNGISWNQKNEGLYDLSITSFRNIDGIYFLGSRSGIFLSSDKGDSWSSANIGLPVLTGALIENNNNDIFIGTRCGIFKSSDNGDTWEAKVNGLVSWGIYYPSRSVLSFTIKNNHKLFASICDGAILFVSDEYGDSWIRAKDPKNGYEQEFSGINEVVSNDNHTFITRNYEGILRSDDNGETWNKKNEGLSFTWYMKLKAITGDTLFALNEGYVLFRTTNNGDIWDVVPYNFSTQLNIISDISLNGGKVIVSTWDNGIFYSSDNGDTWTKKNNGLENLSVQTVKFIGNDAIAADTLGNIYYSHDLGDNWYLKNIGIPPNCHVYKLNYNDTYAFAGTDSGMYRARLVDILDIKDDGALNNSKIYPNPASDFINAADYFGQDYKITDILGNIVASGKAESGKIIVSTLQSGFYGIIFTHNGIIKAERFINE